MVKKQSITFSQDFSTFRIYIDNLPHMLISKKHFQGFTSYKQNGVYFIELYLKTTVLVGYETKENWIKILQLLDENL